MRASFFSKKVNITSADIVPGVKSGFRMYVSGDVDGRVMLWSTKPHVRPVEFPAHASGVTSLSVSPCGNKVASCGLDKYVKISRTHKPSESVAVCAHNSVVRSVQWSRSSSLLITTGDDKCVKLWNAERGTRMFVATFVGHTNWVRFAEFDDSSIPRYAVSCSDDKTVKLWDVETKVNLSTFDDHSESVNECIFMPSNSLSARIIAACSQDSSLKLWDARQQKLIQQYVAHNGPVTSISFHNSGHYIVSSSMDGTVRIWDIREGRLLWTMSAHSGSANCVRFDRSTGCTDNYAGAPSSQLVSAGQDGRLLVWTVPKLGSTDGSSQGKATSFQTMTMAHLRDLFGACDDENTVYN